MVLPEAVVAADKRLNLIFTKLLLIVPDEFLTAEILTDISAPTDFWHEVTTLVPALVTVEACTVVVVADCEDFEVPQELKVKSAVAVKKSVVVNFIYPPICVC